MDQMLRKAVSSGFLRLENIYECFTLKLIDSK
jgi:hypothetical protein